MIFAARRLAVETAPGGRHAAATSACADWKPPATLRMLTDESDNSQTQKALSRVE
jgi:hypothetical protein